MKIVIADRVLKKHKEISEEEILEALEYVISWKKRVCFRDEIVGVGVTKKGKSIEFVYALYPDFLYVFHAQLATNNVLKELGLWKKK